MPGIDLSAKQMLPHTRAQSNELIRAQSREQTVLSHSRDPSENFVSTVQNTQVNSQRHAQLGRSMRQPGSSSQQSGLLGRGQPGEKLVIYVNNPKGKKK